MKPNPRQAVGEEVVVVPALREEARVAVREVEAGGVRVHKTVNEHPHMVDAYLRHDELVVEHVPVDRIVPLSEAPVARQEGATLIVPILEEVLVVEKKCRIKEEIHITRNQRTEHHVEPVVLRTEDVEVERFGPAC